MAIVMAIVIIKYQFLASAVAKSQKPTYFQYFSDPFTTYPFNSMLSSCPW